MTSNCLEILYTHFFSAAVFGLFLLFYPVLYWSDIFLYILVNADFNDDVPSVVQHLDSTAY